MELSPRLATAGAELLVETLRGLEAGTIQPEPQNSSEATLAPILKKEDGRIDWTWPASKIFNRSRGFLPWPGVYTSFRGQLLRIWRCAPAARETQASPGELLWQAQHLYAGCGENTALELIEVQVEGRKRVPAADFVNGVRLSDNEVLGAPI